MKNSKYYKKILNRNKCRNYGWLNKMLISIIIVLIFLILCNISDSFSTSFKRVVLEENMNFYEFNKIYNAFSKSEELEVNGVVNNLLYEEDNGRYKVNYGVDSMVEALMPGIIVFDGEKDELGQTVIVQGNDGVDVWYSGISLKDMGIYDYVSKGDVLGISNDVYVVISIYEDGMLLNYEEYI